MAFSRSWAGSTEERLWQVQDILDRGVLTLTDGLQLFFAGLWYAEQRLSGRLTTGLKQALDRLTNDRPLRPTPETAPSFDRHGCMVAHVESDQGVSIQHALLQQGLAVVTPSFGLASPDECATWLALEDEARRSELGLWRDPKQQPQKASSMVEKVGRISLDEGRVVRTSSNDRYVYLNFGQDWRTDFTIRQRQKLLTKSNVEPDGFDGKNLRIRGFVQESHRPLINISNLQQIEVIP